MDKMNKKGFLLGEETLKVVLAVIGIGFLVFFLMSLYYSFNRNKDLELAESSLNYLIEQIELESEEAEIYNPDKWILASYNRGDMPELYLGRDWENCICICEKDCSKTQNTEMVCVESEYSISPASIEIDSPLNLEINPINKVITKK